MSKELVISANRHETRVALIDDDQLVEVYFQRANEYSLAGSIHKGRVTRVLPGMQSAFVDVGLERDTFLYVSDFLEEHEDIDRVTDDPVPTHRRDRDRRPPPLPQSQESQAVPAVTEAVEAPPAFIPTMREPAATGELPAAESASGALAAPGERTDGPPRDGGDRDRHGRRSRRRRNRGRGFPDSKYAPETATGRPPRPGAEGSRSEGTRPEGMRSDAPRFEAPRFEARPEVESEPAAESTEESAPASARVMLPGESLAKYRGAPPQGTGGQQSHTSTREEAPVRELHAREPEERPAPELSSVEAEPAAVEDPIGVVENEYDEPVHYPPENAMPDAPAHEGDTPEPMVFEPVVISANGEEAAGAIYEPLASDVAHDSGPALAPLEDEDEDRDIQAMILAHVEELDEDAEDSEDGEDLEGADVQEGDTQEAEGQDSVEEAGDVAQEAGDAAQEAAEGTATGEPGSGTASVRERGGRFPHRVSRRSRRRRGGPGQDNRSGEGRPPEGRAEGRPEGRPEGRIDNRAEGRTSQGQPQERTVARPVQGQVSISDLLKEGQEIIVQIAKEPLGQKGARITSHIALPGRYVVYMPTLEHMGVSRKIGSDEERLRLKRVLQSRRPGPVGGFITRTAAEGRTEEEIAADMQFLYNLWQDIKQKADRRPAPMLLHHDLDIVQRILRDQLADSFKAIWIDSEETYENVLRFVERFQPALVGKVKLYTREAPIFDAFNVTAELEKALRPKVWLKSGGYIVINQTEALVAIDVNTGKYVGKSNRLEDTIVKTNTEAIKEIVRQIRLRDLGGIIVIDFIDMDERKNRQKVMAVLEETMRVDRAPYKILQFNDFGLVAITRKRVKQSLERTLCSPCPHCDGAGYIKSSQTVVAEILTEARKMASSVEGKEVMLRVHPDVAKVMKSNQNKYLEELEEVLRRSVLVKSDPLLHHEKFDLA